jgi:hypothetical protein
LKISSISILFLIKFKKKEMMNKSKKIYQKYGWILILLLLIFATVLTEYPFQKGSIGGEIYYIGYALFLLLIAVLIALKLDDFNTKEKFIIGLFGGLISLFISSIFFMPFIEIEFYEGKNWMFWETKNRLVINTIFYGLYVLFSMLFIQFYVAVKNSLHYIKK